MSNRTNGPDSMRRFDAVLALRGISVREFARRCQRSNAHVRAVLLGDREPSEELREAMRAALTPAEWAFVSGESNTLAVATEEAAPMIT
jgi:transcriptional regulator with XRE-family HTH domain